MKNFLIILGICLFFVGPAATIYELENSAYYLILSGIGLLLITVIGIMKSNESSN